MEKRGWTKATIGKEAAVSHMSLGMGMFVRIGLESVLVFGCVQTCLQSGFVCIALRP